MSLINEYQVEKICRRFGNVLVFRTDTLNGGNDNVVVTKRLPFGARRNPFLCRKHVWCRNFGSDSARTSQGLQGTDLVSDLFTHQSARSDHQYPLGTKYKSRSN